MLQEPFLEFVKTNAPTEGNFHIDLPQNFSEINPVLAKGKSKSKNEILLRDHILENVVRPLIEVSASVSFYKTKFSDSSFGGEGARLPTILKKVRQHYELIKGQEPITSFEKFWYGYDVKDGSCRGFVLFVIDDAHLDLSTIFSFCYDPGVMSASNLRTTTNKSLYQKITNEVMNNSQVTVVLLDFSVNLGSLTIFPSSSVFEKRLKEAISSTRERP